MLLVLLRSLRANLLGFVSIQDAADQILLLLALCVKSEDVLWVDYSDYPEIGIRPYSGPNHLDLVSTLI